MFARKDNRYYSAVFFAFGVCEVLLCSGIVYGWAAIVVVFKEKGFFYDKCIEQNTTVGYMATSSVDKDGCFAQYDVLNLVFTVSMFSLCAIQLLVGIFIDKFGPRWTRLVGGTIYILACVAFALIQKGYEISLFPVFCCISMGGIMLAISVYQVSNIIYTKARAFAMCTMHGAFDSSAVVLLVFKILYDKEYALNHIIYGYCGIIAIFIIPGTIFLIPSKEDLNNWSKPSQQEFEESPPKNKVANGKTFTINSKNGVVLKQMTSINDNMAYESDEVKDTSNAVVTSEPQNEENLKNVDHNPNKLPGAGGIGHSLRQPLYYIELIVLCVVQLKLWCFVGSLPEFLERITNHDDNKVSHYVDLFGYIQFGGLLVTPLIGLTFERKRKDADTVSAEKKYVRGLRSTIVPFCITNFLAMVFCVLDLLEKIELQVASYILCTVVRGFLYANHGTYTGIAFPQSQFGTLYGLGFLVAGFFGLLQYAFFSLTNLAFNGNPFHTNVALTILVALGNIQPVYVWWYCKKRKQEQNEA